MTAAVSGFMTVGVGCGLVGGQAGAKPSPVPVVPFTRETVAAEMASYTRAAGLPAGDTSTAGTPGEAWRGCVVAWSGEGPAETASEGFEGTVKRLRQHDWEIVSSGTEGDVTFRVLAKRGWKLYARNHAPKGAAGAQALTFTGIEDGCELPARVREEYTDPS
ncbi:hypothetical protein OG909_07970 [Streptomyces sp. NBC_01754]|uniref:hypothetical protein n=1 Tax=Streptomyces sp. NBC_01754 TaxID=2975930 RepID=UPI002DD82B23|nr:hypothetical protein [Streptomyces sp. NBC_01754]WSC92237.1 hypothetical protein OG909_07970 [Streptomyces sp. NBC_01754]